ncbi:hypothetical protein WBJ53_23465 [Spirosoma sp. SC4-14]|uniref:hypothetical protein n=1 Tax=Spirosoma sp. SC4-14 TaxID=3128900 RepID=UPI0030D1B1E3
MAIDPFVSIILFGGFNEVALPRNAQLYEVEVNGYEVSLLFKVDTNVAIEYRQFYVAFNNAPTDYEHGILRLLKRLPFKDGTSIAMIYEVYPYILS